ncbi:response regulator transcription factor [Geobacter sp. FeAm09]|uniref:LytR/AlgR family response regulator transcription factor n=1 Tax=Geobacter sp. FeAm09 TaxID=2597769 RepID=UPI0011F04DB9|nr:LytTR family DNA-binding domain-containing protein [Geobacter sp. FeAm09]QEM67053.1 response regulator transcription factor [Geobacter sp. FeAm09]
MTITVFIIDDEAPARRELRYLLGQVGDVTVLGEASSPSQGLQGIRETRPQLVFLDIQLPGLSGIELAQVIRELPDKPLVVFATAFEQFAVQAFNVDAFDYILKPFTLERVAKSIHKAGRALDTQVQAHKPLQELHGPDKPDIKRILVHKGGKMIPVPPESIVFIRATEGEAQVHTADGVFTSKSTLNTLESVLEPYSFVRVHRNSLVNLNCIIEIIPWFNGSCKLVMNDNGGSEVLVSRYNAKDLKQRLILSK